MGRGASPTEEQAMLISHVNNLLGVRAAKSLIESMGCSLHVYYSVDRAQGKLERNTTQSPKHGLRARLRPHAVTWNP